MQEMTTVEEMRERICAALAGESGEARAVALKAVEDERDFLGGEEGPVGIDDDAMEDVFVGAYFRFRLWLTDSLIDERPGMTDEELDALPDAPTRAEQWGIEVDDHEATEVMIAYWRDDLDAGGWLSCIAWGA